MCVARGIELRGADVAAGTGSHSASVARCEVGGRQLSASEPRAKKRLAKSALHVDGQVSNIPLPRASASASKASPFNADIVEEQLVEQEIGAPAASVGPKLD